MIARFPVFLPSSDAVAVILALLLVFAMAGSLSPRTAAYNFLPNMAECAGSPTVSIRT